MAKKVDKMPKVISASEAKSKFGSLRKWAVEQQDEVIVEVHGAPEVVLMEYAKYQEYQRLREDERRRQAWAAVETLRHEVSALNETLSPEEAYRLAGFSEAVIEETLRKDQELAGDST